MIRGFVAARHVVIPSIGPKRANIENPAVKTKMARTVYLRTDETFNGKADRTVTATLDPRAMATTLATTLGNVTMVKRNDGVTLSTNVPGYGTTANKLDDLDRVTNRITPTGSSSRNIDPHNGDIVDSTSPNTSAMKA